jgi:hypothetical protein
MRTLAPASNARDRRCNTCSISPVSQTGPARFKDSSRNTALGVLKALDSLSLKGEKCARIVISSAS